MSVKTLLSSIALLAAATVVSATDSNSVKNPIYIISNAEVPSLGRPGLSLIGEQRATQCLPEVRAPPTPTQYHTFAMGNSICRFVALAILHLEYWQNHLLSLE